MAILADAGTIATHFESLVDPRHTRNRKHLLTDVIFISVCAILCGCDGPTGIQRWASEHVDWLSHYLTLANGIPSRDCIRRLLILLKPEAFQLCFQDWIAHAIPSAGEAPNRLVAIDGKTCRGSHNAGKDLGALHIVSAWATEQGIALGQVATEAKSNEITAIPVLLEQIELSNTIITIDAMGCQKDIVDQIVDGGGNCVITVKDNQPKLKEGIAEFFSEQIQNDFKDQKHSTHTTREESHGRIEERTYYTCNPPSDFGPAADWPHVKTLGYTMNWTTHADGRQTSEVRYYIGTKKMTAKQFAAAVRGHWGIESMHWILDVTFREDESRTRERTLANNLSWLRRFAVTLLKRHPIVDSIKGKMHRCSYNTDFLTEVLTLKED